MSILGHTSSLMMLYHDGLRIITAEKARHSSKLRATQSDLFSIPSAFIYSSSSLQDRFSLFVEFVLCLATSVSGTSQPASMFAPDLDSDEMHIKINN